MSVTVDSSDYGDVTRSTMLEALAEARIFSVETTEDGRFSSEESCDLHYSAILTKDQMLVLADELRALALSVEEAGAPK